MAMHIPDSIPISAADCHACGLRMARYYCNICQLFDDEPGRDIYHCPFCNICRRGKGLGRDARHCMQCNCCMSLAEFKTHKCRDLSTCPVCTEYLFDSNSPYRVRLQCFFSLVCYIDCIAMALCCNECSASVTAEQLGFQFCTNASDSSKDASDSSKDATCRKARGKH